MEEIDRIRNKKMQKMMEKIQVVDLEDNTAGNNGKPVELTDSNFNNIISENDVVLVDCWADWCGPCRMLAPTIDELSREYSGKAVISKLNVDYNPVKAREFKVMGIPTMLLFKHGKLVDKLVGVTPKPMIEAKINSLL